MKSVLLVSPYPYTLSNRGMDLLTRAFEASGWDTHHLQFPRVVYSVSKKVHFPSTVNEKESRMTWIPYIDRIMKKIPRSIFYWIVRNHRRSVSGIAWDSYDAIVLESGKPLFLLGMVGKGTALIYRQSDPVRLFLGENLHYVALEDEVFKKSTYILIPKDRFKDTIPGEYHRKISIIPNGFHAPDDDGLENPFPAGSLNAVYVGLAPLDIETLNDVVNQNPGVTFHLFGTGVRGISAVRMKRKKNVIVHPFSSERFFLSYLANATMYIFPFQRSKKMNNVGLTSKYYMAMYFGLPIVSYPMGPAEEFEGLPVCFCSDSTEFSLTVKRIAAAPCKVKYNLPWDSLDQEFLLSKYREFIDSIESGGSRSNKARG